MVRSMYGTNLEFGVLSRCLFSQGIVYSFMLLVISGFNIVLENHVH